MKAHPMTEAQRLAAIARIDALLATLKSLNPLQREELDRMLRAAHQAQAATALTNRVLGK